MKKVLVELAKGVVAGLLGGLVGAVIGTVACLAYALIRWYFFPII